MTKRTAERWKERLWSFVCSLIAGVLVAWAAYVYLSHNILSVVRETADILNIDEIVNQLDSISGAPSVTSQPAVDADQKFASSSANHRKAMSGMEEKLRNVDREFANLLDRFDELQIKEPGRYNGQLNSTPKKKVRESIGSLRDTCRGLRSDAAVLRAEINELERLAAAQRRQLLEDRQKELNRLVSVYEARLAELAQNAREIRNSLVDRKDAMLRVLQEWGNSK